MTFAFAKRAPAIRVWLLAGAVAGSSVLCCAAPERKVVVGTSHCGRLSAAQREWLPSEWQPFLEYTRVCSIQNSKREAVVLLVSAWAILYYKAQPGTTVSQVDMPHPLLFSPAGAVLGSLPYNFPDDPPAELRVTFAQWEDDFPQRIDLFLTDPRAAGSRSLPPLVWDQNQRKFATKGEGSS
jgi:hypothetical protein